MALRCIALLVVFGVQLGCGGSSQVGQASVATPVQERELTAPLLSADTSESITVALPVDLMTVNTAGVLVAVTSADALASIAGMSP